MRRVLFLALLATLALPAAAQRCDTAIADADEQYRTGFFDEAIDRLTDCLDRNAFTAEERRRAYRLLGLAYIGKDREADARNAIRSLLEVAPDYRPDPAVDPPPFVDMVADVRRSQPRPGAGGPAAAGGAVSSTRGFMAAFRLIGSAYSDEGTNLSGGGGDLTLGYGVTPAIAVVLGLSGAALSSSDLPGDFTGATASLGGRFHIGGGQRAFVPYVGAGGAYQSVTYSEGGGSVDASGGGGMVEGGLLYFFNPSLAVTGGISAFFTSLAFENSESFSATTVNVGVGISWSPGQ